METMRKVAMIVAVLVGHGCSCSSNLSADEAAKACVILQACFPAEWRNGSFGGTLSTCSTGALLPPTPGALIGNPAVTTGLEKPLADIYRCVLGAGGDCTKAGLCWARSGTGGTCSPAGSIQRGTCTGQVLSGCNADGLTFRVDCAAWGETCHEDSIFFARVSICDVGACPMGRTQCRGSVAESCQGQGLWLLDCASAGLSCVLPADGGGATCDTTGTCEPAPATCEGSVAVSCSLGKPIRQDCARSGTRKRCEAGTCVETGNECSVLSDRPACDGTTLRFCQDGFSRSLDCAGLGFKACQSGACVATTGGCTPTTCADAGASCGTLSDGCGGTLSCGSCGATQTCGGGGRANVCGGSCTPTTCAARGFTCGSTSNGCGGTLNCGTCAAPQTCSANVCRCTPRTTCGVGQNCGTLADGCGGNITCGTCTLPQTCGGGGTANACGAPCVARTCAGQGYNCGTAPDGCVGTISCGSCTGNRTCGGGGQNVCGTGACTATTCAAQGKTCGVISDGCGATLPCGTCAGTQSCVGNICR